MSTKQMTKEEYGEKALKAAVRLHDYIRTNAGPTADWPIQISSTDKEEIKQIENLLKSFKGAYLQWKLFDK